MANQKHVLIAGGGIAGPSLALLLSRAGHKSTVVEKASQARNFGQQIDVSGPGLLVVRAMGLEDAIRKRVVGEFGVRFVNAANEVLAEFAADPSNDSRSISKEIEIMRGDMAEVLCDACEEDPNVELVFGDFVTELIEHGSGITVSFARDQDREFDLVVAADGLFSKTRELAFGRSHATIRSLGGCIALFNVPYEDIDGRWFRWLHLTGGRGAGLRPQGNGKDTGAYLGVVNKDIAPRLARQPVERQKEEIAALFADAGWETKRLLREMQNNESFYMQEIAQVKCDTWTTGRVALLGDAGYAPSPASGQGTTLSLVGAYILAGCIASYPDHQEAFRQYERQARPFVTKGQTLLPGVPGIANPQTALGIRVHNTFLWLVSLLLKSGAASWAGWALSPLIPFFQKDLPFPEYEAFSEESRSRVSPSCYNAA